MFSYKRCVSAIPLVVLMAAGTALAQSEKKPNPPGASKEGGYFEVPLVGEVGKEISAPAVRAAVALGKSKKASYIVFRIDTTGGLVEDAEAIVRVLEQERSSLKFITVVNRSMSAGMWVVACSDHLFFVSGSDAGAAVAFRWNPKSGQAEVDAKFIAAKASRLQSLAESHGQPGAIYQSMIVMSQSLYQWQDDKGTLRLSNARPESADIKAVEVDTPQTVLSVTARQACDWGWGKPMNQPSTDSIGAALGIEGWHSVGNTGVTAMRETTRQLTKMTNDAAECTKAVKDAAESIPKIVTRIGSLQKIAKDADPSKIELAYDSRTMLILSNSQRAWKAQTDRAIAAWQDVITAVQDLTSAEKNIKKNTDAYNQSKAKEWKFRLYDQPWEPVEAPTVEHKVDVHSVVDDANQQIQKLQNRRNRVRMGE